MAQMAAIAGDMVNRRLKKRYRIKTGRLVFAALFTLYLATGVVAAINNLSVQMGYTAVKTVS